VTRLVLEGLGLSGADALWPLAVLDVLSLKGNALSGAIPDLSPLPPCVTANWSSTCQSAAAMAASSPSSKPAEAKGKMRGGAVAAIVAPDFAVVGLVTGLLFCYLGRSGSATRRQGRRRRGARSSSTTWPYSAASATPTSCRSTIVLRL
jgi:hypothetical protein